MYTRCTSLVCNPWGLHGAADENVVLLYCLFNTDEDQFGVYHYYFVEVIILLLLISLGSLNYR